MFKALLSWRLCFREFPPPTSHKSAKVPSHEKKTPRRKHVPAKGLDMPCWPARGPSMLHRNKTRLRHMLFIFRRTQSQNLGFLVWLGFGGLCLASSEVWEFWLAEFGRRGWVRTATNRRIHSLGPSACNRHHHVSKEICARLSRNGCTPPRTPGKSNVFEFVPRNTMPVLSVMKVRGCRLSVRSCHHQRGCMMSRALTHRTTYVAVLGGGRLNSSERRRRSTRYGENRSVTRLRQNTNRTGTWTHGCLLNWQMLRNCLMARSWVLGFFLY